MPSGPLHTVHVRVNDAATGQPTPVRIRFEGTDGKYYAPFGRPDEFSVADHSSGGVQLGKQAFAHIDGTCEIPLPADPIRVEIYKGFEFTRICQHLALGPGKLALRFSLERWTNLRGLGWYSGDTSSLRLMPHAALLEAAAEDVAVANLLAHEERSRSGTFRRFHNVVSFSGQRPLLEMPGHMVVVNTTNNGGALGELRLLNSHRAVFPLATGGGGWPYDWLLADWCDQCHRKGGLVLWAGFRPSGEPSGPNDGFGGETPAGLVLAKIDAIEVDWLDWMQRLLKDEWYRLLNCGIRVPLVGGSNKCSSAGTIGELRTYARLLPGEEFTYKNWIEAIRAGRTFVSNGPLLTLTVNGQDPGAVIDLPQETRTVRVRAEARSMVRFERLELVFNGEALAGTEASGDPCSALLEGDIEIPGSGWLAARCWGNSPAFAAWDPENQHAAAHTSPVYIQIAGRPFTPDLMSLALLIERIDKMIVWAEKEARFDSDKRREQLLGIFQAARAELVRRGH